MPSLDGKAAVVTGAGMGIGRATSLALAEAGAAVLVFDRDEAAADEVVRTVQAAGGRAEGFVGSVTEPQDVAGAFARAERELGAIDILVNNAGVSGNRPALEIDDAEWRRVMAINLDGTFFCARAAGRAMRGRGGAIVNVGSIFSLVAAPNRLSYCATKAAVAMMSKALAIEWASEGIRVNCVAPGYVDTPLLEELANDGRIDLAALRRRTPQGRLAAPEELAAMIVMLCEPRTAHVTGQVIAVDGGWSAYGFV